MSKCKTVGKVLSQERIADGIYSMWIEAPEIAGQAVCGQFVSLYTKDSARLLPRPISLCEIDQKKGALRLVYRIAGAGTKEFSAYQTGETVSLMGPLGNGYPALKGKVMVIGGGIGIPPMLELAKSCEERPTAVLGYRSEFFLTKEFEACSDLFLATEDGSAGTKGTVLDAIRSEGLKADVICACGPLPMLRAVKEYAAAEQIPCYISMEEKMACGIGACLACVCKTKETDSHSHVHNARVCKDGPVFRAEEVDL